jgi:hypothetical protein
VSECCLLLCWCTVCFRFVAPAYLTCRALQICCIGRDDEIRRAIQVLSRRTKNNPVLIGDPGVGTWIFIKAQYIMMLFFM